MKNHTKSDHFDTCTHLVYSMYYIVDTMWDHMGHLDLYNCPNILKWHLEKIGIYSNKPLDMKQIEINFKNINILHIPEA